MFTLLFLLVSLAVLAASVAAAATRPAPALVPVEALPVGLLGLAWRRLGERQTADGPRLLCLAEGDAQQYSRLYNADRAGMRASGFGWGGLVRGDTSSPVCWERLPAPSDDVYVEAVSRAVAAAADADDLKARRASEREDEERRTRERLARLQAEADEREMPARLRLEVVGDLQADVRLYPWAWTRGQRDRITDIMSRASAPTAADAVQARRLIATLGEMLDRVSHRLETVRLAEWWDKAADPGVRAAALRACRILSELDMDMATLDNGIGWSKAHTHAGHLLSNKPFLDQTEGAHALRAVWAHRRQIRPDLVNEIFGTGT